MSVRSRWHHGGNFIAPDPEPEEPPIRYCPHCLEYGFRERLGPRILVGSEPRPPDYESFLSCYACGRIVPVYEAQKDSEITNSIGTIENPFDQGKSLIGLQNLDKGKGKTSDMQKRIKRMKREIDKEKDLDIKQELKQGHIVTKHYNSDEDSFSR